MLNNRSDVFDKLKTYKRVWDRRQDGDGHEIGDVKVEIREDEEQFVKLQEIIDILVAAGYFRARIKGLSSFDKVVGGMTWCIELCDVDVDVDLLFHENLTIGQKIALTEKIVAVLPQLKCPHNIEPHQIQGLDFIHIFPVVQWLVKRSMEFRQEKSSFVRAYAVNQFKKTFPLANKQLHTELKVLNNIIVVNEVYRPKRCYKRKTVLPPDIYSQVQITLLEYGDRNFVSDSPKLKKSEDLMKDLTLFTDDNDDYKLNKKDEQELAQHYELLQLELGGKSSQVNELKLMEQQIVHLSQNHKQLENTHADIINETETVSESILRVRHLINVREDELKKLDVDKESDETKKIEEMLKIHDQLQLNEQKFKENCRNERDKLQNIIEEIKNPKSTQSDRVQEELKKEGDELKAIRLMLAKKNRAVVGLQRQLDEIPNRSELAQYQRRFLELYNQVSAKHKETKQYYTLYNTLEDTRLYMKKELSLLNSISENYPDAMQSVSGKEEFLKQLHVIVDGVTQSKNKVEYRLTEEKRKRDEYSNILHNLVEIQRKYANTVRQLSIECKKLESLQVRPNNS